MAQRAARAIAQAPPVSVAVCTASGSQPGVVTISAARSDSAMLHAWTSASPIASTADQRSSLARPCASWRHRRHRGTTSAVSSTRPYAVMNGPSPTASGEISTRVRPRAAASRFESGMRSPSSMSTGTSAVVTTRSRSDTGRTRGGSLTRTSIAVRSYSVPSSGRPSVSNAQ